MSADPTDPAVRVTVRCPLDSPGIPAAVPAVHERRVRLVTLVMVDGDAVSALTTPAVGYWVRDGVVTLTGEVAP